MAYVHILFDPSALLAVPDMDQEDPLLLFGKTIKGVFAHHFHAVNEQEKINRAENRTADKQVLLLKYKVCDPALIIPKRLDSILVLDR